MGLDKINFCITICWRIHWLSLSAIQVSWNLGYNYKRLLPRALGKLRKHEKSCYNFGEVPRSSKKLMEIRKIRKVHGIAEKFKEVLVISGNKLSRPKRYVARKIVCQFSPIKINNLQVYFKSFKVGRDFWKRSEKFEEIPKTSVKFSERFRKTSEELESSENFGEGSRTLTKAPKNSGEVRLLSKSFIKFASFENYN